MSRTADPRVVLVSLALLASSCGSPAAHAPSQAASASAPKPSEPEKPWTTTFAHNVVLIADELRVEGPPGLLDHVVVTQSNEFFVHEERTLPEGLLQTTQLKPDAQAAPPIRVRLDAWTADIVGRVTVLERAAEAPVVVEAKGSVYLRNLDDGTEQRTESLRVVGPRP